MSKFVRSINWEALRKQKATLLEVIEFGDIHQEEKDDLDGILHLIDALQDWAVDEEEVSEELVFGTPEDQEDEPIKYICTVCGQATASDKLYCDGGHLMMGVAVHHKETLPDWWGKATDIFGMDDETLKTYIENQVSIVILNRKK